MAKLPKKYIKKYGISKKAWSEYKKSLKAPTRKSRSRSSTLTKQRSRRSTVKTKTKRKSGNMNFNFGGGLGKGIMAGAAAGIVNKLIPVNIAGVDLIVAGMMMKDKTCQNIGAITLGRNLAGSITGMLGGALGGNGGGNGEGWL